MAHETEPKEILAILLEIRGWSSEAIAQASGLKLRTVHAYERGERTPDDPIMRRLATAMGFPATVLERTAAFIERMRTSLGDAKTSGTEEARQAWIGSIAYEAGRSFEELVGASLHGALLGAGRDERRRAPLSQGSGRPGGAESMPEEIPNAAGVTIRPLAEALTILRLIRKETQKKLAAVSGLKANAISNYERGRGIPKPEDVRKLVEAMGFTAASLGRALSFVEGVRAAAVGVDQPECENELAAQIDLLAGEEGRAVEAFTQARLQRVALVARVLGSRRRAPALWKRLSGLSRTEQRRMIDEDASFHTTGFCELLCEESVRAAGDSAAEAVHLSELAVRVASRDVEERAFQLRLEGFAGFHLSNMTRVAGKLPAAEHAHDHASERWEAGAGSDPGLLNEARVFGFEASLRRDQRRFPEALALLDRGLACDRWGETTMLMIAKAKALEELGDFDRAITLLRQAASRPDTSRQPQLFFWVRKNLATNLCNLGLYSEAKLMLSEVRSLAQRLGHKLELVRVKWLEGKVAAGLGWAEEALEALEDVRSEFLARDIAYDAALVTLEIAEVHASLGHIAQVKLLARELAPVFDAQGVHREAQRALEYFRAAAEAERLSLELVRAIITYLYRARRDPQLRFEAPR